MPRDVASDNTLTLSYLSEALHCACRAVYRSNSFFQVYETAQAAGLPPKSSSVGNPRLDYLGIVKRSLLRPSASINLSIKGLNVS